MAISQAERLAIRTMPFSARVAQYIDRKLARRPALRQAEVTAVTAPTISIAYPDEPTVDIPGVRCVGFGAITLPSVSDMVWVLAFDDGTTPICIGEV